MQNILKYFYNSVEQYPNYIAIQDKERAITYGVLAEEVQQTANYFYEKGIRPGDRVLLFVPMSVDLYRTVLGLFHLGAVAVFLDEWVSKERMELCCQIADCRAFIGIWKARAFTYFSKPLRKIPIKLGTKYHDTTHQVALHQSEYNHTALITFTTGSTGTPKAANRTHGFLNEQFESVQFTLHGKAGEVDMPVLPIFVLINLGIGATSVMPDFKMSKPTTLEPQKIINQFKKYKVTRLTASPFFVKAIAKAHLKNNEGALPLEKIFTGGAPVFPDEATLYQTAFPTTNIMVVYGSTEAEPISEISADILVHEKIAKTNGLRVGEIYPKAQVKIIKITTSEIKPDTDLNQLEMPKGEIGEIIVAGHHVLKQYWNNEKAFRENKIVVQGEIWHRTGDGGFFGTNNELYLTGRCKQMIRKANTWISPFLVEYQLAQINGISRGTVVERNKQILVVIEKAGGKNEQTIRKQIQQAISFDIDHIHFIKKMPLDPRHQSKIDYGKVMKILDTLI